MNRLILALAATLALPACKKEPEATATSGAAASADGSVAIKVDATGYHPAEASAPAGKPVKLVFTRTTDDGCGQQLVFPDLDIRKDLPLNQPVTVDVTMPASGKIAFACGMDMYRGSIVAK
jgi:plastocyanin domain-containing protein